MREGRTVCVTGIGVLSPIGTNVPEFLAALQSGRSGIRALRTDFSGRIAHNAFGVVDLPAHTPVPKARLAGIDRFSQFALIAAHEAVADAGLKGAACLDRAIVCVGTGMGGAETMQQGYEELLLRGGARVNPLIVVKGMNNAAAAHIAIDFGCHGHSITYSTACSSSAIAIGEALLALRSGRADVAIAGGTEALLTLGTITAWEALRTLAIPDPADPSTACRPFAADRTGLVLAEGAGFVVLEEERHARERGATVHARLSGYGTSTDATHMTKPDPVGQAAAIQGALVDAGLRASEVGYINAHGTATLAGDIAETQAIKQVFGTHATTVLISSTKSMHGHLMGATGAVELIASLLALRHGFAPPTINLHQPDPQCDLDYVANQARRDVPLEHVMSNSFAFGGSNAVLVASRAPS
ncbi:MAG TPA: beta-ketoacyl-[acyl-carrier-protein] synthase family protein [Burkholderiaceae bacterium]|nr:beta-ketoacyl-[acyl-carrier-protein] synthase family protein [Burkholderiaceae bacterium]